MQDLLLFELENVLPHPIHLKKGAFGIISSPRTGITCDAISPPPTLVGVGK